VMGEQEAERSTQEEEVRYVTRAQQLEGDPGWLLFRNMQETQRSGREHPTLQAFGFTSNLPRTSQVLAPGGGMGRAQMIQEMGTEIRRAMIRTEPEWESHLQATGLLHILETEQAGSRGERGRRRADEEPQVIGPPREVEEWERAQRQRSERGAEGEAGSREQIPTEPREEEAASGVETWRIREEPAAARGQGGQGGQDTLK
jgi:hypothetical protein